MPSFPLHSGQRAQAAGSVAASSKGTNIATPASANTKGSYAQLIASTSFPARGILVQMEDMSGSVEYLVDIAIGGSGSEVVIIPNLTVGYRTSSNPHNSVYYFPIAIPAGTRIACRAQSTSATGVTIRVSVLLFGADFMPGSIGQKVIEIGTATADSGGTSIDPGGTAHTKGSYTELTSSSARPIRWLVIGIGSQANAARGTQAFWLVDIAIGSAGSEQVIIPDLMVSVHTTGDGLLPQNTPPLPVNIPQGTRISARAQSSETDATDRTLDVMLYGVTN